MTSSKPPSNIIINIQEEDIPPEFQYPNALAQSTSFTSHPTEGPMVVVNIRGRIRREAVYLLYDALQATTPEERKGLNNPQALFGLLNPGAKSAATSAAEALFAPPPEEKPTTPPTPQAPPSAPPGDPSTTRR